MSHHARLSDSFSQPLSLGQQIFELHVTACHRRGVSPKLRLNRLKRLQHFWFGFESLWEDGVLPSLAGRGYPAYALGFSRCCWRFSQREATNGTVTVINNTRTAWCEATNTGSIFKIKASMPISASPPGTKARSKAANPMPVQTLNT